MSQRKKEIDNSVKYVSEGSSKRHVPSSGDADRAQSGHISNSESVFDTSPKKARLNKRSLNQNKKKFLEKVTGEGYIVNK